jgi:urease accessory protein
MNRIPRLCCALGLTVSAMPAVAHPFHGASAGFASGFAHPFLGIDHLLVMLAVGAWAMQQGGRAIWRLPVAFCAAMAIGAALGYAGVATPHLEPLIAASVFAFGLLILTAARVSLACATPLVAFFALFHGMAHGLESAPQASAWLSVAGLLAATMLLHAAGSASAALLRARIRVSGAPLVLTGAWLLSRAFA